MKRKRYNIEYAINFADMIAKDLLLNKPFAITFLSALASERHNHQLLASGDIAIYGWLAVGTAIDCLLVAGTAVGHLLAAGKAPSFVLAAGKADSFVLAAGKATSHVLAAEKAASRVLTADKATSYVLAADGAKATNDAATPRYRGERTKEHGDSLSEERKRSRHEVLRIVSRRRVVFLGRLLLYKGWQQRVTCASLPKARSFGYSSLSARFYLSVFQAPTPARTRPNVAAASTAPPSFLPRSLPFSRLSTRNKKSSTRSFLSSLPFLPPQIHYKSRRRGAHDLRPFHLCFFIRIPETVRGCIAEAKVRLLSPPLYCFSDLAVYMDCVRFLGFLLLPEMVSGARGICVRKTRQIEDFNLWFLCSCQYNFGGSSYSLVDYTMEQKMVDIVAGKNRKRKANEATHTIPFLLDELNEDLLERVLSWLPASSLFRLGSVCKRWRSVATSETFHIACSQIPSREPWFLMVDHEFEDLVVYDTSERNWKSFTHRTCNPKGHNRKAIPVAASGGLVCYRTGSGGFFVCNLLTGSCRELPPPAGQGSESHTLHAIAMYSSSTKPTFFKIVLVLGKPPNLVCRVFDSARSTWEDEITLLEKADSSSESQIMGEEIFYFLSKAGDVVATNMQRSPSKQYSSVLITENSEQVVYFLSETGTVVACNLTQKTFFEYPRILPIYFEYSIDVVGCKGEMLVVVMSEFLETASLRVWKFSKEDKSWKQVAAMPPAMSHEFHGQKMDINCTSYQDVIFICASSSESSRYIMFSMEDEEWVELPRCNVNGKPREFMSAISFEPRVEATFNLYPVNLHGLVSPSKEKSLACFGGFMLSCEALSDTLLKTLVGSDSEKAMVIGEPSDPALAIPCFAVDSFCKCKDGPENDLRLTIASINSYGSDQVMVLVQVINCFEDSKL
ncbi:hypothetical protein ZIOFF_008316 [Zingiber officinale]|uniref:F-box domain-containing protein n=1 Tax=Zingiber officinale TaxID=94328 RepID=A0A8J5LQQ2_ZINOF|nr:hypothetical protein ZIOFF_008316 [Zingiber officinale]